VREAFGETERTGIGNGKGGGREGKVPHLGGKGQP